MEKINIEVQGLPKFTDETGLPRDKFQQLRLFWETRGTRTEEEEEESIPCVEEEGENDSFMEEEAKSAFKEKERSVFGEEVFGDEEKEEEGEEGEEEEENEENTASLEELPSVEDNKLFWNYHFTNPGQPNKHFYRSSLLYIIKNKSLFMD